MKAMNKGAFSMIEVVFVIVIIGIMASTAMFYMPHTALKQASETMMTNLKYTKTLAQLDDRNFLMNDSASGDTATIQNRLANQQRGMWQFQFHSSNTTTGSGNTYTIYAEEPSNTTTSFDGIPNNIDIIAIDPMTKECISGYSGTNLRGCDDKYAKEARFYDTFQTQLESIQSDDCKGWSNRNSFAIYFDSKGNPYCKVANGGAITALTKSVTIKLKRKNESAYICITKGGVIDGGNVVDNNNNPIKDAEGRMRGIPVGKDGKCYDI